MENDLREELLRVKARESRHKKEAEEKIARLDRAVLEAVKESACLKERLKIALDKIDAMQLEHRQTQSDALAEIMALKAHCAELEAEISRKSQSCPVDGSDGINCTLMGEVHEFMNALEGYQVQLLEDTAFSSDNAVIFLCRCGSRNGIIDIWKAVRQYIVAHGAAAHAVSFLDGLLRFHALGNRSESLKTLTPQVYNLDMETARQYWVLPWRENWWLDKESVRHVLLPGLRDKNDNMLVEPLLALKSA